MKKSFFVLLAVVSVLPFVSCEDVSSKPNVLIYDGTTYDLGQCFTYSAMDWNEGIRLDLDIYGPDVEVDSTGCGSGGNGIYLGIFLYTDSEDLKSSYHGFYDSAEPEFDVIRWTNGELYEDGSSNSVGYYRAAGFDADISVSANIDSGIIITSGTITYADGKILEFYYNGSLTYIE